MTSSTGSNLASSKLQLTAVGYAPTGSPSQITPAVADSKSGKPVFRRVGKTYVLAMKLPKTLARGSYLMYYTVGSDPTVRSIQFEV